MRPWSEHPGSADPVLSRWKWSTGRMRANEMSLLGDKADNSDYELRSEEMWTKMRLN